jgi:hypothetical protein
MPAPTDPVSSYVTHLNGRLWGIALGILFGSGLFLATNLLVLKGGEDMGQHLGLLGHYFPGYSVTFLGSLVGFVYAFFVGYLFGRVVCLVYNRFARGA